MTDAVISVVIPARNAATTITRQLEAVLQQQTDVDVEVEVVVVDNGSTDTTASVVTEVSALHRGVHLVAGPSAPNRSAARNLGARAARGSVLVFCDADDVVEPGWLAALLEAAKCHRVVSGSLVRVDSADAPEDRLVRPFATTFRGLPSLAAGNFAIDRSLFEQSGGFAEDYTHRVDIELSCRLHLLGARVAYVPEARVRYARRSSLRGEVRQHFRWAIADVQIQKRYRHDIDFAYSWRNSAKHWVLLGPRLVTAVRSDELGKWIVTFATLAGRLVGSVRYRIWAI